MDLIQSQVSEENKNMDETYTKIYTSLKISPKKLKKIINKIFNLSNLEQLEMESKMFDIYSVNIKDYKKE